ncbi:MAG: SusD/RagB family nutrient-binding outer membrane lipoprotein [Flavobacteriaceae bacterium]|nr:SusD/RagB family nutrient-binding outer membrane lipoprotein [Flavobacteriaceae bacterium]
MKKLIFKSILIVGILTASSCESIVEDINANPNDILTTDVENRLFLTGSQLANIQLQLGHLNRIGQMYSGQLIGFSSLYSNIYGFNLSTAEANSEWNALYVGVMTNMRKVASSSTNPLLVGIAQIVEAHAAGTAASIWGDIPYTEAANPEISDPTFDGQLSVYNAAISLLDQGIATLQGASSGSLAEDIYFNGDKNKWIAAAYTLKARFNLHKKDYAAAASAAASGISSADGDMRFYPKASANTSGDKNLFFTILEGSRAGDIGNSSGGVESYLIQMLDSSTSLSRNNAKTDETARLGYYRINSTGGSVNDGVIAGTEPQNMVTYFENELILAEAKARAGSVSDGLPHLNNVRAWLNSGGHLNDAHIGNTYKYEAYAAADFEAGGMENSDNVSAKTAFLREVIQERYVSGFGTHMAYNDARRLRKSDSDYAVPFVLVNGPNPPYPERMPYATNELNSNENAPAEDPGIFTKTAVNQ